jgi:hypothetical protein
MPRMNQKSMMLMRANSTVLCPLALMRAYVRVDLRSIFI